MSDPEENLDLKREAATGDRWKLADPYEYFMGRWSRLVAPKFIEWLAPPSGLRWLDVGCGSGALSETVLAACHPSELTAIDQSQTFVREMQRRIGNLVQCKVGDAVVLPVDDASVDHVISGLVLNFISEPLRALKEMKRVTAPGGTVAIYVWDYSGKMELLTRFWNAAVKIDPNAKALQEAYRFANSGVEMLRDLFADAGFLDIASTSLEIQTRFRDFEDYWKPFLGGQGPAPSYLMSLDEPKRQMIRSRLENSLPLQGDGSIVLEARAWAVKGEAVHSTGS